MDDKEKSSPLTQTEEDPHAGRAWLFIGSLILGLLFIIAAVVILAIETKGYDGYEPVLKPHILIPSL